MKVGTDAVVLGAWLDASEAVRILEIGTGCGIIALMLAQKSKSSIDAIDVDEDSFIEADENFNGSPWNDRLKAFHISLKDFAKDKAEKYDLIVSNPPFFRDSLLPSAKKRQLARHNTGLTFEEFLYHSSRMLGKDGRLAVILPVSEAEKFRESAEKEELYLNASIKIFPKPSKPKKRVIMVFTFLKTENPISNALILRDEEGVFSTDYINLTKDFHTYANSQNPPLV
jgi:tRNA1Val (adenine37-N6)-methyltransferase